jgi:hypothetical protein
MRNFFLQNCLSNLTLLERVLKRCDILATVNLKRGYVARDQLKSAMKRKSRLLCQSHNFIEAADGQLNLLIESSFAVVRISVLGLIRWLLLYWAICSIFPAMSTFPEHKLKSQFDHWH